jgi:hypothetical protein
MRRCRSAGPVRPAGRTHRYAPPPAPGQWHVSPPLHIDSSPEHGDGGSPRFRSRDWDPARLRHMEMRSRFPEERDESQRGPDQFPRVESGPSGPTVSCLASPGGHDQTLLRAIPVPHKAAAATVTEDVVAAGSLSTGSTPGSGPPLHCASGAEVSAGSLEVDAASPE